jgi:hypothetical protein
MHVGCFIVVSMFIFFFIIIIANKRNGEITRENQNILHHDSPPLDMCPE